jgi:hypothetical protein
MDYEEWKVENWNRAHREMDISALTGSTLDGHLEVLAAEGLLGVGTKLLCIGVGTGAWVQEAVDQGAEVECLDVSVESKEHIPVGVPLHVDPTTLPENTFDLALSLWVAPHMTNHDLETQVREVVWSLKSSGVFCVHYKEPMDDDAAIDNREGADDEWKRAGAALMLRRRRHFDSLVGWAGGIVVARPIEHPSQFYKIIEVSAHIMRRTE